ncbi:aldehyde dehydrogenase [Pontibacter vulgaris]|uniref:aldehyde dehydrogenase n=1 Tax=Pontibacter vulgaris TaxID=2905679 RepID=UPI001FA6B591|nr:aldehyde dehydrogenase [Pontibacter vulgaris]
MKTTLSPASPDTRMQQPIVELLQKQRAFFSTGQTLSLDFRKAQLRKLQQAISQHEQEIFDALYADFRKPELESFVTEVGFIEQEIRLVLNKIGNWVKPKRVKETLVNFPAKSYIYSEPYGIALIIGPWNYPFQLVFNPLIGAIAAGNCAIIKPSELTVNTSAVISKIIRKTFDEAYIAAVEGGPETTQQLLAQRFDTIFFTGSTHVGRIVMKAAAEHLTPVTLELGGKSPAIVAADADLDLTARRIVWGKFLNAGQTCVAPDYLLVQEEVKEELIQLLGHYITQFYGQEPATSPDFARIINGRHFQRLKSMLGNSSIRVGGATNAAENYVAPTVLDRVSWEHPVMQEEIFGPLLPVLTFREIEDAIRMVNSHEKPLALYFFSSNKEQQEQVLQHTSFGGGCINDTLSHLANPNLPFGGVGGSGIGSYHGQSSFDVFSNQKSILKRGTWLDLPLRYPPYKGRLPMLRKVFKWL